MPTTLPNPPMIYDLAAALTFIWESVTGRYRSKATGRFVAEKTILSDIERYNERELVAAIDDITDRFLNGRIDLPTWQRQMAREVKDSFVINLQVGRGGVAQTTFVDYGRIGGRLRRQYRHLNDFARKIQLGDLTEAQIRANARQYANAPRTAFYDGLTAAKFEADYVEERRILQPAEHCGDCIRLADLGWQTIGTLPEPGDGSTVCGGNDKCLKQYRKADGVVT